MSVDFVFTESNLVRAQAIMGNYPAEHQRSAVMPLLHLVQEQNNNWIPDSAVEYIADMIDIPQIWVKEVMAFYSLYNTNEVGKYLIKVCRTISCWLCGSQSVLDACKDFLGVNVGETTEDKKFTLMEIECLGACKSAPVVQINDTYYENLTKDSIIKILTTLSQE